MSIAVSVIILPSRTLARLVLLMSVLATACTIYVLARIGWSAFIALIALVFLLLLSAGVWIFVSRHRQIGQIDIADSGGIIFRTLNRHHVVLASTAVTLSEKSSLWPYLLLLHLQPSQGKVIVVPILRDSVGRESFRMLSVALQWISVHASNPADVSPGNF
ncbi:hypothetical protein BH11PSE12_BH11PSE12_30380 [soil metagenome]